MLIDLLKIEPSDRNKKDLHNLELLISEIDYIQQLDLHQKLLRNIIKGLSQKATVQLFQKGSFIIKDDDKVEKLHIILQGKVLELLIMNQEEFEAKRQMAVQTFPRIASLLYPRAGRKITVTYDKNHNLYAQLLEFRGLRRSQVVEQATNDAPDQIRSLSIQNQKSFRASSVPKDYIWCLQKEIESLFQKVYLQNHFHFEYIFEGLVLKLKQGRTLNVGQTLNQDIQAKKHENHYFALEDCQILTIPIHEYSQLLQSLDSLRIQKLCKLLENAFNNNLTQDQLHTVVKLLINKIQTQIFSTNSVVYQQGQKISHFYVVKKGEFQIIHESVPRIHGRSLSDMTKTKGQSIVLAQVGQGCLLGEEVFDKINHEFKCISTNAFGKVLAIKQSDITHIANKYPWFKNSILQRQTIKSNWLNNRLGKQQEMEQTQTQRMTQVEKNYLKQLITHQEYQVVKKFQRMKPKKELETHEIQQILEKNDEVMKTRQLFNNTTLRDLTEMNQTSPPIMKTSNEVSQEQQRIQLVRRITQHSLATQSSARDVTSTISDGTLIPMLLRLDKKQCSLLKHVLEKTKMKMNKQQEEEKKISAFDGFLNKKHLQQKEILPVQIRTIYQSQEQTIQTERGSQKSRANYPARLRIGKRILSQSQIESKVFSDNPQMVLTNGINQFSSCQHE
ncbi:hypothetical protein pb186bvf_005820 [Paramecium bursaria]